MGSSKDTEYSAFSVTATMRGRMMGVDQAHCRNCGHKSKHNVPYCAHYETDPFPHIGASLWQSCDLWAPPRSNQR